MKVEIALDLPPDLVIELAALTLQARLALSDPQSTRSRSRPAQVIE